MLEIENVMCGEKICTCMCTSIISAADINLYSAASRACSNQYYLGITLAYNNFNNFG